MKPKETSREHSRLERVHVSLEYTQGEIEQIGKMTPVGEIIPGLIDLVWERHSQGPWRRLTGIGGSRAWGHVLIAEGLTGPVRSREIFTKDLTNILPWAEYLMPGLRQAISEAEAELPE